jgi:hypothetical protein
MPPFLQKMFKYQEQLDINEDSDVASTLPTREVARSRQQRSRMFTNKGDVKEGVLGQIEQNEIKRKVERLNEMKMGQEMARDAEAKLKCEEEFFKQKKEKAKETMRKHWDE